MPNTLIREGYLDSDRVSALSDFEDRVFFRILLAADDAGRTDGRAERLRSVLFPTRQIRSVEVESAVTRLIADGLLRRWTWDDKAVLQVMRWQRRSGAQYSKYPDDNGTFEIKWCQLETRDGKHAFCFTSIPPSVATHVQPIANPFGGVSEKPTETETETHTKTETVSTDPPKASAERPTLAEVKEYAGGPHCSFRKDRAQEWFNDQEAQEWRYASNWRARMRADSAKPYWRKPAHGAGTGGRKRELKHGT